MARDPSERTRDVWGYRSRDSTTTVASHVSRLRCALALAGAEGWVNAIWGVDYRLAPGSLGPLPTDAAPE